MRKKSEGQQATLNKYEEKRMYSSRVVSDHTGKEILKHKPLEKMTVLDIMYLLDSYSVYKKETW